MKNLNVIKFTLKIYVFLQFMVNCSGPVALVNNLAKKSSLGPIGATRIFEIYAKVETLQGVTNFKEEVKGIIVGHITTDVTREKLVYRYSSGGFFYLKNEKGDRLIIDNKRNSSNIEIGALGNIKIIYFNGNEIRFEKFGAISGNRNILDNGELRSKRSLNKYGFRILEYGIINKGIAHSL